MYVARTLTLALLLLCSGAALAQTPDLLPPARETVCDNETGAAYGLCNAYCEAMDCETDTPSASPVACDKVGTKFQNITGRNVPCELSCPCQGIPEFTTFLTTINYCYESETVIALSEEPFQAEPPNLTEFVGVGLLGGEPACAYINYSAPLFISLPLTPEQAEACTEVLHAATASRNVTCQPIPIEH